MYTQTSLLRRDLSGLLCCQRAVQRKPRGTKRKTTAAASDAEQGTPGPTPQRLAVRAAQRADAALCETLQTLDAFLGAAEGAVAERQAPESPGEPAATATSAKAEEGLLQRPASTVPATIKPSVQGVLKSAVEMGVGALKDYIKPTSLINKDEDDLPRARPVFCYAIMLLNIAVYAVGLSFRFTEGQDGPTDFFLSLANVNDAIEGGEYYRLITANFLHDSLVHLGLSSYALLTFAPEAEAVLGGFTFAATYLLGGVAGAVLCFLLTDTLTVGASSGIFALVGALAAFLYKNHRVPTSSDQLLFTATLVFFNLFLGGKPESAIDNLGHLGGLLCGAYLGVLLTPAVLREPSPGPGAALDPAGRPPVPPTVLQPNPLQSLVVVLCVCLTLGSGVAAAVLHRTGTLPPLRPPPWLG